MRLEVIQQEGQQLCYLCRLADQGARGVVWALEPRYAPEAIYMVNRPPEWGLGVFYLYVDIQNAPNASLKSSKKNRDICKLHYDQMYEDWIYVTEIEVAEYNAWQAWLERVER